MTRDDSIFLIENGRNTSDTFKMTKTRTAMFLVMIIVSCALIFSITDAYPTPEAQPEPEGDAKLGNNSRLVITHVVKTIEFEVGVVDDDGSFEDNMTDSDVSQFYETDIQLLNLDLLKEVVKEADDDGDDKAAEEDDGDDKETVKPSTDVKTPETEGQMNQMRNESIYKIEKSTS